MSSDCNFTIGHYREILATAVGNGYQFIGYDIADSLPTDQFFCILRHDVDYMPEWTVRMGRIERELGITSTYFFQVCAKTYNLRESLNFHAVRQLVEMGHTIGLHFDLTWKQDTQWEEMAELCKQDKDVFHAITGIEPCKIISFHNPHRFVDSLLNKDVPGLRHTYEKRYFSDMKYLSDSQGWYEGCVCKVFAAKKYPVIQLLTHADYWPEYTQGDFISDTAQIVKLRSEELTRYLVTFHPVCKKNEERLRAEIRESEG